MSARARYATPGRPVTKTLSPGSFASSWATTPTNDSTEDNPDPHVTHLRQVHTERAAHKYGSPASRRPLRTGFGVTAGFDEADSIRARLSLRREAVRTG
jgi:hypothetical protein